LALCESDTIKRKKHKKSVTITIKMANNNLELPAGMTLEELGITLENLEDKVMDIVNEYMAPTVQQQENNVAAADPMEAAMARDYKVWCIAQTPRCRIILTGRLK